MQLRAWTVTYRRPHSRGTGSAVDTGGAGCMSKARRQPVKSAIVAVPTPRKWQTSSAVESVARRESNPERPSPALSRRQYRTCDKPPTIPILKKTTRKQKTTARKQKKTKKKLTGETQDAGHGGR